MRRRKENIEKKTIPTHIISLIVKFPKEPETRLLFTLILYNMLIVSGFYYPVLMLLCVSNFFILFYFFYIFINTFRQNFEPRRFRSKLGYHAIIEFIHWMQLKLIKFIFPNSKVVRKNISSRRRRFHSVCILRYRVQNLSKIDNDSF